MYKKLPKTKMATLTKTLFPHYAFFAIKSKQSKKWFEKSYRKVNLLSRVKWLKSQNLKMALFISFGWRWVSPTSKKVIGNFCRFNFIVFNQQLKKTFRLLYITFCEN